MDALWEKIEDEILDQLATDETSVMTKVVVIAEVMEPDGKKNLARLHFDRSGKQLKPWELVGALASSMADVLDKQ